MSDAPLLDRDWRAQGVTFDDARDAARLGKQRRRVLAYCLSMDCELTLREISAATGDPESSVSASLREIRSRWRDKATGEWHDSAFNVDTRFIRRGLHGYRVSRKSVGP